MIYQSEIREIRHRLAQIQSTFTVPLAAAAWEYDTDLLDLQLEAILNFPDVRYAKLDIVGYTTLEKGQLPQSKHRLENRYPLHHNFKGRNNKIGELLIVSSKDAIIEQLWQRLRQELLVHSVINFLVAVVILLFFHQLVTSRLRNLKLQMGRMCPTESQRPIEQSRALMFRQDDELDEFANQLEETRQLILSETLERKNTEHKLIESEERFRLALLGTHDGLWDWDLRTNEIYYSPSWLALFGHKENTSNDVELWKDGIHPEDRPMVEKSIRDYFEQTIESFRVRFRIVRTNGDQLWVLCRGFALRQDDHTPYRFIGTHADITWTVKAEDTIRKLTQAIHHSPIAVLICNSNFDIEYCNPKFKAMAGMDQPKTLCDEAIRMLTGSKSDLHPKDHPVSQAIASSQAWEGEIITSKTDQQAWHSLKIIPFATEAKEKNVLIMIEDISERKHYEDQLFHQANYDSLTGLPNRTLANEHLKRALIKAKREGTLVGIIFLDLDQFKLVNDSMGHDAGDDLLVQVAKRLQCCIREQEIIARFGGDEFIVVLPDIEQQSGLEIVAERLLNALSPPLRLNHQNYKVSASIGISAYPLDGVTPEQLIQAADTAMYKSKDAGRSTYHFFTADFGAEAKERVQVEIHLPEALRDGQLQPYFQPIVDLSNRCIVGAEVLSRWFSPELGFVSPETFIEIAEKSSLIYQIDRWVLDTSCAHLRKLRESTGFKGYLSVNIDSRELQNADFLGYLEETLERYSLPPSAIRIEITERSILNAKGIELSHMELIHQRGVNLCIDDFGTGYSALCYLIKFPFSVVKLDRSFVQDVPADARDSALVKSIVRMVQNLNMRVVAEGIESPEQAKFLGDAGCELGQGYLFAKPCNFADFVQLLLESKGKVSDVPELN